MKIGVVAYEMEAGRTGVGRYLEGLLQGLAQCAESGLGEGLQWRLFFKGDPFEHPLWSHSALDVEPFFDDRPTTRPILWEQFRLPGLLKRAGVDAVFSPAYSLPRLSKPALVTMHDLSFEHLPAEFPFKERWRRRVLARRAVRQAQRVLTDTHHVAEDLSKTYGLDPSKIGVVPLGFDLGELDRDVESSSEDASIVAAEGVHGPYLLYLGSILERRQIQLMIQAFAKLAQEDPDLLLVIAGRNRLRRPGRLTEWIETSGISDRIIHRGYVAQEAVGPLYRQARLSLYLSAYEGYGLPPLESLAAGTPAVVAPGLALDDFWPEYPYRCSRLDVDAAVETTRHALADSDRHADIVREAEQRFAGLTWQRSGELFLAEVDRALS